MADNNSAFPRLEGESIEDFLHRAQKEHEIDQGAISELKRLKSFRSDAEKQVSDVLDDFYKRIAEVGITGNLSFAPVEANGRNAFMLFTEEAAKMMVSPESLKKKIPFAVILYEDLPLRMDVCTSLDKWADVFGALNSPGVEDFKEYSWEYLQNLIEAGTLDGSEVKGTGWPVSLTRKAAEGIMGGTVADKVDELVEKYIDGMEAKGEIPKIPDEELKGFDIREM